MKVNDLRDIIVYYVRVNQDKEVNMKYPKDSSLPHPGVHQAKVDARLDAIEANVANIRNNFIGHTRALETKVKQLEDRAQTQRDESSHSEAESKVLGYRLDKIESEIEVMSQIITKNTLALDEIEKRIAIMQEKIDGID